MKCTTIAVVDSDILDKLDACNHLTLARWLGSAVFGEPVAQSTELLKQSKSKILRLGIGQG